MENNKRVAIAYIVANTINYSTKNNNYIYDYENKKYYAFSYKNKDFKITIYDYNRDNYIIGKLPNLFDYATDSYIYFLNISDDSFKGFDYKSKTYFSGTISDKKITIYDYETNSYYNFLII